MAVMAVSIASTIVLALVRGTLSLTVIDNVLTAAVPVTIVLSENQEVAGIVDKLALVALQRFSDGDNKVMKIVIRQWAS